MENLARIIAVTVHHGQIQPCVLVNRGIYVASHEQGAKFHLELTLTYTSGGHHVGPVTATLPIHATSFRQALDSRTVRAQGERIAIPSQPDRGTPIVCSAKLMITDASGAHIECGNAETSSFPAP
jgi:hypothetical protein